VPLILPSGLRLVAAVLAQKQNAEILNPSTVAFGCNETTQKTQRHRDGKRDGKTAMGKGGGVEERAEVEKKEDFAGASKAHKSQPSVRTNSRMPRIRMGGGGEGGYEILNRGAGRLLFQINVRPVKRGRM